MYVQPNLAGYHGSNFKVDHGRKSGQVVFVSFYSKLVGVIHKLRHAREGGREDVTVCNRGGG